MKTFVYVTPSHERMLETFLIPSLPKDLELIIYRVKQSCRTGDYMSEGFVACMTHRAKWMFQMISENQGERIMFIDADIQFFTNHIKPIICPYLDTVNLVSQNDSKYGGAKTHCGGFLAVNACLETMNLFAMTLGIMSLTDNLNDQLALNMAVKRMKLKSMTLPLDLFWSPRLLWRPDRELNIPATAIMHHANWCVGIKDKMKQLAIGRSKMSRRKDYDIPK